MSKTPDKRKFYTTVVELSIHELLDNPVSNLQIGTIIVTKKDAEKINKEPKTKYEKGDDEI